MEDAVVKKVLMVSCRNCDKRFEVNPKKKNKAIYCSRNCFQIFTKKMQEQGKEQQKKEVQPVNDSYAPVIIWGVLICLGMAWFGYNYVIKTETRKQINKSLLVQ